MSNTNTKQQAQLVLKNRSPIQLPVLKGSLGQEAVDVTGLGKEGLYAFDPGFMSTVACQSSITYIDGAKGCLLYRGYPIEELVKQYDYLAIFYLLLKGELPAAKEQQVFANELKEHMSLPKELPSLFSGLPKTGHPMALLMSVVSALAAGCHNNFDINNHQVCEQMVINLVAKMPVLAAMCYRHTAGLPFIQPKSELSYAANFLHMLLAKTDKDTPPGKATEEAMDLIFSLHADHGQNASTSTLRMAGSTGADPYAAVVAGIAALWGPLHGGANEACLAMLKAIGDVSRIPEYIEKAKDPSDPFRLMGFGHRVYKSYDPRAKLMRTVCHRVLDEQGRGDEPLFRVAMELEKIALEDDYFKSRSLYPNVDFYSGITQSALGIPTTVFTVIFAVARTAGWVSHWLEMVGSPYFKLSRPRQLYMGPARRTVKKGE